MRKRLSVTIFSLIFLFIIPKTFPHCQIPCGIYNDELRFKVIEEHIVTSEKSMKQIEELSQKPNKNYNQIVRWVLNKENHADEIAQIVTYYFMTQRLKPVAKENKEAYGDYLTKITFCHEMLVYAMKAKQTTDLAHVEKLRQLLKDFHNAYFP
ncbi:MAG: superoxide dismutase [Candidatus Aminicenantes bacterium]|nr:MAG: superoxide dismutase [Candidatus Aminicenantes bacterium]